MKNTTVKIEKSQVVELEKQIHNLENCIGILQHKLKSKQKFLRDLQNHQGLVNLLYYNILSKEKDVSKIQDSFKKLIENANLVINKLPPDLQEQVKEKAKSTRAKALDGVRPLLNTVSKTLDTNLDLAKNRIEKSIEEVKAQVNQSTDAQYFEKKYEEYKAYCDKQGEKITSKEEFKQILNVLNTFKEEIKGVNVFQIINQLDKDITTAKGSILGLTLKVTQAAHNAVQNLQKSVKTTNVSPSSVPTALADKKVNVEKVDKQKYFKEWVGSYVIKSSKKTEYTNYNDFYEAYRAYLESSQLKNQILAKPGFTSALNKHNPDIKIVEQEGVRLVKAKIK